MSDFKLPPHLYTDAPPPYRNAFLGTLQIFAWLLLHPSAWRSHVARIDPKLPLDFSLTQLSGAEWRNPELIRLLIRGHVLGPLLVGLLLAPALFLLGVPAKDVIVHAIPYVWFCMLGGVISGAGTKEATGIAVGVVGGLSGGVAFGVAVLLTGHSTFAPLAGGVSGVVKDFMAHGTAGTAAIVVAFGVAAGAIFASVGGPATDLDRRRSLRDQHIGGVLIGMVWGGLAIGAALITAVALSFTMAVAVTGGLAGVLSALWRTHKVLRSVAFGFVCALNNYLIVRYMIPRLDDVVVVGVLIGALLAVWFYLPYMLTERISGRLGAAVAGLLGLTGGWLLIVSSVAPPQLASHVAPILLVILCGMLLSLTSAVWRPLLFYPLEAAWSLVIYQFDIKRYGSAGREGPSWLRFHPAFWDELQRWPFIGLDEHLLLILERNPEEAQAAMAYLAAGPQRFAAQAAQIEAIARGLERCTDTSAIAKAHRLLGAGELEGPASALLRRLSGISGDVDVALSQSSVHNQRLGLSTIERQIDTLLGELDRSSERYAVRFRPIALGWQKIISQQAQRLTEMVEQRQEIDNPYVIGVPLTLQQEIFVGRTDISAHIEQLLLDRRQPPLLLYGQRRMGKTSLLNNLGRLLPTKIVPLFADLQGPASSATDHAGLLYNLSRCMIDSARKQRSLALPVLPRDALTADPFTRFDEWLDEVEALLGERTALLALDEMESLDRAFSEGRFSESAVLGMLRHLIQHRPRWKMLLASSHSLDELSRWASYLVNVQVVEVGYLKPAETLQLIERPVKNFALRYEAAASSAALSLTRGHPFLVQLLCAELVALKNEQEPELRRLATLADVEGAVEQAQSHGSFFFADIERNQIEPSDLPILRRIAQQGSAAPLPIAKLRTEFPIGLDEAIERLRRRALIEKDGDGLRFQVELIRRWFGRT